MLSVETKSILKIFILLFFPPGGRLRLLGSFNVTKVGKNNMLSKYRHELDFAIGMPRSDPFRAFGISVYLGSAKNNFPI